MNLKLPQPIVYLFENIVNNVKTELLETLQAADSGINTINYLYGSMDEVRETLQQYDESPEERFNKYPLIVLVTPFHEKMGEGSGYYSKATVRIGIAHHTDRDKKSKERYQNNIVKVLLPLYETLLEEICESGYFVAYSRRDLKHTRLIRDDIGTNPFMQMDGITFDYIDAIEIQDLELTVNWDCPLIDISKVYGKNN